MSGQFGRPMHSRDWLLLATLAACFSGAFAFNRVALADLPPLTIVLGRVALGTAALLVVLRLRGERLRAGRQHWRAFLVLGALGNALPFVLTVAGQTRIPSGLASILIATTPLCTMMAARLLTHDEKPSPNRLAGMLLRFLWAVIVVGPGALRGLG